MTESYSPRCPGSVRARSNDSFPGHRERIKRARQAAEALFRPKRPDAGPSILDPQLSAEPSEQKPRILPSATVPVRYPETEAPANLEPPMPLEIPPPQLARIRACVKYGMTIPQVAQIYGVAVSEIERLLRKT